MFINRSSCLHFVPRECKRVFWSSRLPCGQKTDYMQVGWMIALVLDHEGKDEHNRYWTRTRVYMWKQAHT